MRGSRPSTVEVCLIGFQGKTGPTPKYKEEGLYVTLLGSSPNHATQMHLAGSIKRKHDKTTPSSPENPGKRTTHPKPLDDNSPIPPDVQSPTANVPATPPLSMDELIVRGRHIVHLLYNERDYRPERLRAVFTANAYLDFDGQVSTVYESQLGNHEWLAKTIPICTAELLHASATISRKTQNGQVVLTLLFPNGGQGVMRGGHVSAKWRRDIDQQWRCCSFSMLFGPQGLPFGGKTEALISKQGRS